MDNKSNLGRLPSPRERRATEESRVSEFFFFLEFAHSLDSHGWLTRSASEMRPKKLAEYIYDARACELQSGWHLQAVNMGDAYLALLLRAQDNFLREAALRDIMDIRTLMRRRLKRRRPLVWFAVGSRNSRGLATVSTKGWSRIEHGDPNKTMYSPLMLLAVDAADNLK